MVVALLRALARLPLRSMHALGALLGWIAYLGSPVYAARMRANLRQSGIAATDDEYRRLLRCAIAEAGKSLIEVIAVWWRDERDAARLVLECENLEAGLAAQRRGKGVILLTPHLGCFEVCAIYAAQHLPITVLYRPPHLRWLEPLMITGRGRGRVRLATTDLWGVRKLYVALRQAEAVGLLPDQAPGAGDGVWADFFGRPAYTMTLATRLHQSTGAAMFLAFAERLPKGRGYRIRLRELCADVRDPAQLNRAIEELIRLCPEQYLWGYNRYKTPAGARKKDEGRRMKSEGGG